MKNKILIPFILLFFAVCFNSQAQPGANDPTFNPNDIGYNYGAGFTSSSTIFCTALQSDGKIIMGGGFAYWNSTAIKNIARLKTDGTLDSTFNPGSGVDNLVYSLAIQSDGKIIIGGNFTSYNGATRNRIARINTNGTLDNTFNPGNGANGIIHSIAIQQDGKIIIGGEFYSYNEVSRSRIARLCSDGTLDTTFNPGTGTNEKIYSVAIQNNGKIIVGGQFTSFNGTTQNRIACLNTDGTIDASFNSVTGVNASIETISIQSNGKIIIGGDFNTYNGYSSLGIARLNSDGTLDNSFNGGATGIKSIAVQSDGKIIVGGIFASYNGTVTNSFARLKTNGELDSTFIPKLGTSTVHSIVIQSNGKIIIGGVFTAVNYHHIVNIGRLNSNGTIDQTFNAGTGVIYNTVKTVVIQNDGKIIIGGDFSKFNGVSRNGIALLNGDGTLNATFNPGIGATYTDIRTIALQSDGKIFIGGFFNNYNGTTRNKIARLNANGTLDATYNSIVGIDSYSTVNASAIQSNDKVIIGGDFETCNGMPQNQITRLNTDATLDGTFSSGTGIAGGTIYAIALQSDGKIIIGGSFSNYNGTTRNNIARLNSNGSLDATFNPNTGPNGTIQAIAIQSNGKIIIGGNFTLFNSSAHNRIIRLNADGTIDTTFNIGSGANANIYTIKVQSDGKILIGGWFTSYNGTPRIGIARLNSDGTLDTTFNPGSGAPTISALAIQNDGKMIIGGSFTSYNGTGRNRIARLLNSCINYYSSTSESACGSYTAPDGQVYSSSGVITAVIPSFAGCDSIITINLTVNQSTSSTIAKTVCNSYTAPDGQVYTTSGIKTAVIPNAADCDSTITINLTVNPSPVAAGTITGSASVCKGQNSVTYTVPTITNAISYIWTLPTGATGTSTTNSITVNYGTSAVSGDITVKGNNTCGDGAVSTKAITVNTLPVAAGTITGSATVCQGESSVTYTVPTITNATSYVWSLPTGATGTSTTNIITVHYGTSAVSGDITVKGTNSCGDGASSNLTITVTPLVEAAGTITGTTTVCQGQNSVTYTVPTITNAISYIWTLPTGATGTSTTNSITVNYGTSATSGNITVKGTNSCGDGAASTLTITVKNKPTTPVISLNGNILHSNAVSGNQWWDQNSFINGATNQNYTVTVNGDYHTIVTLLGCSSDASNTIHVTLTGVDFINNDRNLKVYPNPVSNELIIEIEGNNEMINFDVLNAIGQVIYKGSLVEKTTVQTSNFAPGVYLIKLENGKTFEFKKIIKE